MRSLRLAVVLTVTTLAMACGDDDVATFRVQIENISPDGLINSDRADGTMPLSAGVWAVFDGDNPLFDEGDRASRGLELLAEDGIPSAELSPVPVNTDLLSEARRDDDVRDSGLILSDDDDDDDSRHLFAGDTATFVFSAEEGEELQIVMSLLQSNDLFIAFEGDGLDLFTTFGGARDGNVTDELRVYDAGTEENQPLGRGASQPLATMGEIDVGTPTNQRIRDVTFIGDRPPIEDYVRVIITPLSERDRDDDLFD